MQGIVTKLYPQNVDHTVLNNNYYRLLVATFNIHRVTWQIEKPLPFQLPYTFISDDL